MKSIIHGKFDFSLFSLFACVGSGHGKNVRLQETGKETNQKTERRIDGIDREANSTENQFEICGESGVRVRNEGCIMSGINDNERYVLECVLYLNLPHENKSIISIEFAVTNYYSCGTAGISLIPIPSKCAVMSNDWSD